MMVFKMKPFDYLDLEESIIFNEIKKMINECDSNNAIRLKALELSLDGLLFKSIERYCKSLLKSTNK